MTSTGDSQDSAFGTQQDATTYAGRGIEERVTSSYYGFLYVKPGGQCGGNRPCQFHVFINSKDSVVLNTEKTMKKWQKKLIKKVSKKPFQTTPVDASVSIEEQKVLPRKSVNKKSKRTRARTTVSNNAADSVSCLECTENSEKIKNIKAKIGKQNHRHIIEVLSAKIKMSADIRTEVLKKMKGMQEIINTLSL